MNFVPCVAWVAKGIAKSCPEKLQLSPEELKQLIQETEQISGKIEDDTEDEESQSDRDDENDDDEQLADSQNINIKEENTDERDIEAEYNMDTYDDDDGDQTSMGINSVAVFVDNKDDEYITKTDDESEGEKEELEDFMIKDSDNLLVVGHVEEDRAVLEIYVYNREEDALYVHHDIVLSAYPLALEWLDFYGSNESPGNYIAIGDMSPVIKIFDLDVVDIIEPEYCLGEELKKKKKKEPKIECRGHEDAVISLSWNKHARNILASGSADSSIIIWDLEEQTVLNKLIYHTGKVQALQWHPFESPFLLSGCTDGLIRVYDHRSHDAECKSWSVDGEIERVQWNLFDSLKIFCSTDTGFVYSIDMRSNKIENVKAHNEGITGLDMSQERINILLTASMDKTVKIWNIEDGFTLLRALKLKVGSIYIAKFAPDSSLTVAFGGNSPSNNLKVMDIAERIDGNDSEEDDKKSSKKVHETQSANGNSPAKKKIKIAHKYKTEPDASSSRTFTSDKISKQNGKK
ncbi:periodic tryptophan protein 1 homolog [Caerostris darwini]|uniref:Periodic tryptophan protein 1 homolog n=1 Tax=Caerostris darwini TaxID=1538125 RepID=A0AAV4RZF6_9ARAC|nr:periodic tryptophan protein 1 homolog [Caerostris darwini]